VPARPLPPLVAELGLMASEKEGFLLKVSSSYSSVAKKYVVLANRTLHYYKDQAAYTKGKGKAGLVLLDGAHVLLLPNGLHGREGYHFGVLPQDSTRMFVFIAATQEERAAWVDAIVAAGALRGKRPLEGKYVHSGWLERVESGLMGRRRRTVYCALSIDGHLAVFAAEGEVVPLAQLPVKGDTTVKREPSDPCAFLLTHYHVGHRSFSGDYYALRKRSSFLFLSGGFFVLRKKDFVCFSFFTC